MTRLTIVLLAGVMALVHVFMVEGRPLAAAGNTSIEVTVMLLNVGPAAAPACPSGHSSCKSGLSGAEFRLYDRKSSAFIAAFGHGNPDAAEIFNSKVPPVSACTINKEDGSCFLWAPAGGQYEVVLRWQDPATEDVVYSGRVIGPGELSQGTERIVLEIIRVLKKDGTIQYAPGRTVVVPG